MALKINSSPDRVDEMIREVESDLPSGFEVIYNKTTDFVYN